MAIRTVAANTVLTKNKSTAWFGALYNMNLYRGCAFGCIYCEGRGGSFGAWDFDEVCAKENALARVRAVLAKQTQMGVVATSAWGDPYNPFEETECLTQRALACIRDFGFGAMVNTKSDLVVRDIALLREIKLLAPVLCCMTITTTQEALAKKIEPRAPSPARRFEAIRQLSEAGIPAGVLMMPILPFVEDTEENITQMVRCAADAQARFVYPYFGVTMRCAAPGDSKGNRLLLQQNQSDYFLTALEREFASEGLRGQYLRTFGTQYECYSLRKKELTILFEQQCEKYGLLYRMKDIVAMYQQEYLMNRLR